MLLINLVVILFLSLFNYITFYDMGKSSYEDKFVQYNSETILDQFKSIDENLSGIIFMADLYFADIELNDDVLYPQMSYIGDKPERVSACISNLQKIRQSNPMLFSLDVYYENTSTVITGFSNLHFLKDSDDVLRYIPWFEDAKNTNATFIPLGYNSYPEHYKVLTYVKKFSSPKWKDKSIWVALHIDPYFSKYLDGHMMQNFYIFSSDGQKLYSVYDNDDTDFLRNSFAGLDGVVEEGTREVEIDNQKFLIQRYLSSLTGLEYYYTLNFNLFDSQYYIENHKLFWIFILSIIANAFSIGILCLFDYCMFKSRLFRFSRTAGLNIDRKASLDSYLDSASKEIINLNKSAKAAENLKIQQKIRSAILDYRKDRFVSEFFKNAKTIAVLIENPDSTIIASIDDLQADFDNMEVFDILNSRIFITSIGKAVVCLVFFDAEEMMNANIDAILHRFHGYKIDISEAFLVSEDGIPRSYDSALDISRYRFLYGDDVLSANKLNVKNREIGASMLKRFNQIEKDLKIGLQDEFKVHLDDLVVYLQSGNFSIDFCLSTCTHMVSIIYRIMLEEQVDAWNLVGYDIRDYAKKINNINEWKEWILNVSILFFEEKISLLKTFDNDLQSRISNIIDENLENDISLGFVADSIGIRSDTLSHMFKQFMGKNYIDYIKEKKMLRAIEYLRKNMPVQEISEKLGYRSAQYFIMVFKNTYGLTPFQYKKTVLYKEKKEANSEDSDNNIR